MKHLDTQMVTGDWLLATSFFMMHYAPGIVGTYLAFLNLKIKYIIGHFRQQNGGI